LPIPFPFLADLRINGPSFTVKIKIGKFVIRFRAFPVVVVLESIERSPSEVSGRKLSSMPCSISIVPPSFLISRWDRLTGAPFVSTLTLFRKGRTHVGSFSNESSAAKGPASSSSESLSEETWKISSGSIPGRPFAHNSHSAY